MEAQDTMVFYKDISTRANTPASVYNKLMTRVDCGETSISGKMIYLGGTFQNKSAIGVIKFDHTFKALKFQVLNEQVKSVKSMVRIIGTDILICGGERAIMSVKLDKKAAVFMVLANYENVGEMGDVGDLCFHERYLFGLLKDIQKLVKFEYPNVLAFDGFYAVEHSWWKKKLGKK